MAKEGQSLGKREARPPRLRFQGTEKEGPRKNLKLGAAWCSWEWDDIADVGHAGDVLNRSL